MHIILNEHIEKLKNVVKGKMGIFIDAANLEQSVRDMWINPKDIPDELKSYSINQLQWSVDYEKIKNFFQSIGKIEIIRFYSADFQTESHRKFMYFLKKRLKFSLNTKPLKKYDDHTEEKPHRKANFDVEIGVDATFYMNKFDTFILFSGDCDFEYLLKFMRGNGKIALVFSKSGHVAKELPPAASHYFDIIDFRSEILRINLIKAKNLAN